MEATDAQSAAMLYAYSTNLAQPCMVKNTFLHIVNEGQEVGFEEGGGHGSKRREKSAPPSLKSAHGERRDWADIQSEDSDNSVEDADQMNSVCLEIASQTTWMPQGGSRQVSTASDFTDWSTGSLDLETSPLSRALCGKFGALGGMGFEPGQIADTGSTPESSTPSEVGMQDGTGGMMPSQPLHHWQEGRIESWDAGHTTVMVRQIPRQFSQLQFLKEVNKHGYEGLYDFLYLPFDVKKGINVGYGFVNFLEPKHAQAFRSELDGLFLDRHMRMKGKPLRIHPAKVQGFDANYQHFSQTKTGQKQDPHFSPLFFPRQLASSSRTSTMPSAALAGATYSQQTRMGLPPSMPVLFEGSQEVDGSWEHAYAEQAAAPGQWAPQEAADCGDAGMTGLAAAALWTEQREHQEGYVESYSQGSASSSLAQMQMQGRPEDFVDFARQGPTEEVCVSCPNCGSELRLEHKFCVSCGAPFRHHSGKGAKDVVSRLRQNGSGKKGGGGLHRGMYPEEALGTNFIPSFQSKRGRIRSQVVVARYTGPQAFPSVPEGQVMPFDDYVEQAKRNPNMRPQRNSRMAYPDCSQVQSMNCVTYSF